MLLCTSDGVKRAVAALVVLTLPDLKVVHEDYERIIPSVPYSAGFLAFREVPAYQLLLARLPQSAQPQASITLTYAGAPSWSTTLLASYVAVFITVPRPAT